MVVHVGICRLGELVWVVAEVLVLDWKGRREWGYGYACWNMQVMGAGVGGGPACRSGELVLVVAKMMLGQWAVHCELADRGRWGHEPSSGWRT